MLIETGRIIEDQVKHGTLEIMNERELSFAMGLSIRDAGKNVYFDADFGTHFPKTRTRWKRFKEAMGSGRRNIFPDIVITTTASQQVEVVDAAVELKHMGSGPKVGRATAQYDRSRIGMTSGD